MFERLFTARSQRCRTCGVQIPHGPWSRSERRYLTPEWCDRCLDTCPRCGAQVAQPSGPSRWAVSPMECDQCLDLVLAQQRAHAERRHGEVRNLVRRWVDNAPAYAATHPARDSQRHETLWNQQPPVTGPLVHALDIDDALDALTKLRMRRIQMPDEDWPAPFPERRPDGLISFEGRTLREFDRFAEERHAAVPRHLDALCRSCLSGSASSMEALQTIYYGSVYRSGNEVCVVWIQASRELVYG